MISIKSNTHLLTTISKLSQLRYIVTYYVTYTSSSWHHFYKWGTTKPFGVHFSLFYLFLHFRFYIKMLPQQRISWYRLSLDNWIDYISTVFKDLLLRLSFLWTFKLVQYYYSYWSDFIFTRPEEKSELLQHYVFILFLLAIAYFWNDRKQSGEGTILFLAFCTT